METVFECPHCSRAYPILPTLVGRKVRCTFCKNIFQLQHDGTALKITVKASQGDSSGQVSADKKDDALEPNQSAQKTVKDAASEPKQDVGVAASVRPQTKALRRKTERIKKIRSSLQHAAQDAISNVQDQEPDSKTRRPQQKPGSVQHEVVLSQSGEREQRYRGKIAIIILAFSVLILLPFLLDRSIERETLKAFSQSVSSKESQYPHRISAYRKRMWLFSRDGTHAPSLIVNADDAQIEDPIVVDWPAVVTICAVALDGKQLLRRFALWCDKDDVERISKAWVDYADKVNVDGFYESLIKANIEFVRYRDILQKLSKKGFKDEVIYVAGLLLLGTADKDGVKCRQMGLGGGIMPTSLVIHEFHDTQGLELINAGGYYSIVERPFYCGLIAGFSGFPDQDDEWRVLDMRTAKSMDDFYKASQNPLHVAAEEVYAQLRDQSKIVRPPNPEKDAQDAGGRE